MSKKSDICIVGGGASGLVLGVLLARAGKKISLFEQNSKIGRKILATGNGRCNVTNEHISASRYHGENPSFVDEVVKNFTTSECIAFFKSIGIALIKKANGRYYPMSNQASCIVEALEYELQRLHVKIFYDAKVERIEKNNSFFLHVKNNVYSCNQVIIATGGVSMKKLGSSDSGYMLGSSFGHEITPVKPSLVQLLTKECTKKLAGVKIEGEIRVLGSDISSKGDILFTPYGVSGSATLDISRFVEPKTFTKVNIDAMPSFSREKLENFLYKSIGEGANRPLSLWLHGFINKKLAVFVLERCKILSAKMTHEVSKKEIKKIVHTLKNLQFEIAQAKGFEFAEVTAGGVSTEEIDPKTFESKLIKGLYFIGEVLDIDGDCGGFNLHFAWGSAHLCCHGLLCGE